MDSSNSTADSDSAQVNDRTHFASPGLPLLRCAAQPHTTFPAQANSLDRRGGPVPTRLLLLLPSHPIPSHPIPSLVVVAATGDDTTEEISTEKGERYRQARHNQPNPGEQRGVPRFGKIRGKSPAPLRFPCALPLIRLLVLLRTAVRAGAMSRPLPPPTFSTRSPAANASTRQSGSRATEQGCALKQHRTPLQSIFSALIACRRFPLLCKHRKFATRRVGLVRTEGWLGLPWLRPPR
jgi:hypothetical protein